MTIRQAARQIRHMISRWVWSNLSKKISPTWSLSWFWCLWQLAFALDLVYLSSHLPVPGVAIGVLGLLAVVATFEHDPTRFQRSIWIIIATGFLLIELNAIQMDRLENQGEQAEARAVDQTRFSKTSAALQITIKNEQDQRQLDQNQFRATIARLEDSINTQTGGNTFCYVSFVELYGARSFSLKVVKVGHYPLKSVEIIIRDGVKAQKYIDAYPRSPTPRSAEEAGALLELSQEAGTTRLAPFDFATDARDLLIYSVAGPDSDFQQYFISLRSFNHNDWYEEVMMKKTPGPYPGSHSGPFHWAQAINVTAAGNKKLYSKVDPDYPLDQQGQPRRFGTLSGPSVR